MKKIAAFFTFLLVLNVLAAAGLGGYLLATGRLDKEKSLAIVDILKHQGTPDHLRSQVNDVLYPTTIPATATAPATRQSLVDLANSDATLASLATAQERIDFARHAVEQERMRLESETRNLLARQKLLEDQRAAVTLQADQLAAARKRFDEQVQASATRLKDENFQRTVALYNDLKPKQVKELLISLDQDLVADYFRAFDGERSTKIIAEFKTPDEKQFISAVLEKIRTTGTASANSPSPQAGTQPAANVPAKG
jgi:hypothetical protein